MPKNMKKELRRLRLVHDLVVKTDCAAQENEKFAEIVKSGNALPENVFEYVNSDGVRMGEFYKISDSELSPEEKEEYIKLKQSRDINIIRNCVIFFTVLTALGLLVTIMNYIALLL